MQTIGVGETQAHSSEAGHVPAAVWEAHRRLTAIAQRRAQLDAEEAEWLTIAERVGVHVMLGFGSFVEYVERALGHSAAAARERWRVARRLGELPAVSDALHRGELSWSGARELARVATADTEEEWLEAARGKTARQVEQLVSGMRLGDRPEDAPDPGAVRHVLRFEIDGATYATWREAIRQVQAEHGGCDEEEALLAMARRVLGGPDDEGRANYQIAVTVCPDCGHATQDGRGEPVPISDEALQAAYCDGQHIGDPTAPKPERASQTIPPAVRRQVLRRDHHRCVVPGCRSAVFVDLHHLRWRSEGGRHHIDNLCTLCGVHHRALHSGALRIEGTSARSLSFFHADGTPYCAALAPPEGAHVGVGLLGDDSRLGSRFRGNDVGSENDVGNKRRGELGSALRGLGFRAAEARRAVKHVLGASDTAHVGDENESAHVGLEAQLRAALALLTPR